MILKQFATGGNQSLRKLTKTLAENYDYNINFDKMTVTRAEKLTQKAEERISESTSLHDRIKYKMIAESMELWTKTQVQTELTEGLDDESVDEAKVILAAQEISDKIQGMIEDAAKMQVQDLIPIVDAMKSDIGTEEAASFSDAADEALGNLTSSLKAAKDEYDNAVAIAQGTTPAVDMDSYGDDEADLDIDDVDMSAMDDEELDLDDEFGGDDANVGDEEPSGRELKDEL